MYFLLSCMCLFKEPLHEALSEVLSPQSDLTVVHFRGSCLHTCSVWEMVFALQRETGKLREVQWHHVLGTHKIVSCKNSQSNAWKSTVILHFLTVRKAWLIYHVDDTRMIWFCTVMPDGRLYIDTISHWPRMHIKEVPNTSTQLHLKVALDWHCHGRIG